MSQQTVKSPCVENCCLNEDDVCLGCFRTLEEILSWSSMSLSQKRTTLNIFTKKWMTQFKSRLLAKTYCKI